MKTRFIYISGGEGVHPTDIKTALDEIRKNLGLSNDVVLFGIPVDKEISNTLVDENSIKSASVQEHKVLPFPSSKTKKSSILNVIENPLSENKDPEPIFDDRLIVDENSEESSITDLLGKMPGFNEEEIPTAEPRKNLAEEFNEFLEKNEEKPALKKAKPFKRKKNVFTNVLGDLFSYNGIAANDDAHEFKLPDFIKRP